MPNTNMCEMQNMHSSVWFCHSTAVCVCVCARGHLGVVNLQRSFVAIGQRLNTEQGYVCTSIASCKIPIDVTTKNITTTMLQHINTNNNDNMCYKKVTHRHTHSSWNSKKKKEMTTTTTHSMFDFLPFGPNSHVRCTLASLVPLHIAPNNI